MSTYTENYQPDNRIFMYLFLSVLCVVTGLYYCMMKVMQSIPFSMIDVLILLSLGAAAVLLWKRIRYKA